MPDGTIMVGLDDITLVVQHHGFVVRTAPDGQSRPPPSFDGGVEGIGAVLGVTSAQSQASKFKFEDLSKGRFVSKQTELPSNSRLLWYMPQGVASAGWELAL